MTSLNWEKSKRLRKRQLSIPDEKERIARDAAARWLAEKAKLIAMAAKHTRPGR